MYCILLFLIKFVKCRESLIHKIKIFRKLNLILIFIIIIIINNLIKAIKRIILFWKSWCLDWSRFINNFILKARSRLLWLSWNFILLFRFFLRYLNLITITATLQKIKFYIISNFCRFARYLICWFYNRAIYSKKQLFRISCLIKAFRLKIIFFFCHSNYLFFFIMIISR